MITSSIGTEIGFDIESAVKCVQDYSRSVQIDSFLIDSTGKTLFHTRERGCIFCKKIQNLLDGRVNCEHMHLYGSYQAERFGGKYIFYCPVGLVHWASPIIINGIMQGAILAGPVSISDREEILMEETVKKYNIRGRGIDELREAVGEVQIVEPQRVTSLSELLFVVSCYLSDKTPAEYREEMEYMDLQSEISEYIHLLKSMGSGDGEVKDSYPIEKERELLSLIAAGDKNGAKRVLNEILGHVFFATGRNFEIVKARVLELLVLLSRAALEGGASIDEIFGLNFKYLKQIHNFTNVEELASWLSRIMMRFTDCVFDLTDVKHVDVLHKALDYIKKNYMKKISLSDVAENAHISPSYFSKVFKDEMRCNFNTYLNRVRVNMSKKLLLDPELSLVEVAMRSGFEDQSYFTKVFKKITGLSPGKYRESLGRLKEEITG
ncbi:MAG: hypothetical protein DRP87_13520 [Spirochaetes bacterium]|nr:MAG: hypothetical protein DRP87_13520 [Spirochaetota bacterium]